MSCCNFWQSLLFYKWQVVTVGAVLFFYLPLLIGLVLKRRKLLNLRRNKPSLSKILFFIKDSSNSIIYILIRKIIHKEIL